MPKIDVLAPYEDERGNRIEFDGSVTERIRIVMNGTNNRLVVRSPYKIDRLTVEFYCDNALVEIGPNTAGVGPLRASIRAGSDCTVRLGANISCTGSCVIAVAEGESLTIGDDAMIATNVEIRADDGHPIFDVRTGKRVNPSQSITIGNHVWLARSAVVLGGVTIGDGSVIGNGSTVTRDIPNNCVAVGSPARVVRRDIAWERPGLAMAKPFYKPDSRSVTKSPYWNLTVTDGVPDAPVDGADAEALPWVSSSRRRWGRRRGRP